MLFKGKVKRILEKKSGEEAIMAIDNLLYSIFISKPKKLSGEEKNIVYIGNLEREVNNGGFSQFFFNTSGDYSEGTVQALKEIGSIKFSDLVESAIAQFPESHVPINRVERAEVLEKIEDEREQIWDELNAEFYKYEEDIYALMRNYILKNIKKFR